MKLVKGSPSLCLPADKTWVSVGFSKGHTAEDFGWLLKYPESKNQKLVAVSDAVVVQETYYSDGGNAIWIGWTHGDHDYYAGYMHNKEKSNLKIGTKLKQGDPIAIMGKTGTSRGEHVHLVLIKAPKGTPFDNNKLRKYRIAPSTYPMYVYPNQEFKGGEVDIKPLPKPKPQPSKPKYKAVTAAVVNDVILGKYGNGATRKTNLEKAGYNYNEVQSAVNKQLGAKAKPKAKPSNKTLKRGSKVKTTATRDIFGTRLDKSAIHPNRTFTVEQIGRNGNMNHILLKEVMTWVHEDTVKVV